VTFTLTELHPNELASLRQLASEPAKKSIPVAHGDKLLLCGFAKAQGGTLVITARGHAKLTYEVTRASWFAKPV
jgi:hypothetical protein